MTAFTTPSTWTAGQSIAAATLNAQLRDNMLHVTEIQNWTPTITQSATVSKTVNYGRYRQQGKWVWCQCYLTCTSSGTAGSSILLTLPVTAATLPVQHILGSGKIQDVSVALYIGAVAVNSTTTVGMLRDAGTGFVGASPNFGLVTTDTISFDFCYEAA